MNVTVSALRSIASLPAAMRSGVAAAASAMALLGMALPAGAGPASAPAAPTSAAPAAAPIRIALIESLSGPFANTGEAVYRNVLWATERVNARGGVRLPAAAGGARPLALERYDSKGQNEEALSALRAAIDALSLIHI